MEKRIIKAIIAERQQEISKIQLVERPIYFEEQANYVLVGIRRAGKSYQMYQDIQNLVRLGKVTFEDCLYINFEDERISSIEASELGLLLQNSISRSINSDLPYCLLLTIKIFLIYFVSIATSFCQENRICFSLPYNNFKQASDKIS